MKYCKNCSRKLNMSDLFCPKCGTKTESEIPQLIPPELRDYSGLESMVKSIIKDIANEEYYSENDDDKYYIYEEVMKTFYGQKIFDWINNNAE